MDEKITTPMMRIEKIRMKGVGPFQDETITFDPPPRQGGAPKAEIHLFTGPNGSGKSTVLHALAAMYMIVNHQGQTMKANQIGKRLHHHELEPCIQIENSYGQHYVLKNAKHDSCVEEIEGKKKWELAEYKRLQVAAGQEIKTDLSFACFAYSGYRDFSAQTVETIQEIKTNPLYESLVFHKEVKNQVNQWLANMIAKEAISLTNHQPEAAQKYRRNIGSLEKIIQTLLKSEVRFELETNPTDIVLRKNGATLDFDVIPDGLKSIISWVGDLLMRLDRLPWVDDIPIVERNIILFLDEIEVHLHPKWQMKILPIVQKLFPNAQIFISTHSPFVVNSVDDAWIYKLKLDEKGVSTCAAPQLSETGKSYSLILDEIFDVEESFGLATEEKLDRFYAFRKDILAGEAVDEPAFTALINDLLAEGMEVEQMIGQELRQIKRIVNKDFAI